MSDHKSLIKELAKYNITCSYDETRRFRRSAAVQSAKEKLLAGMSDCSLGGLVQIIIDNFDSQISSQNCRIQCHCMAMLATQYQAHVSDENEMDQGSTFPRLKQPIACETPITQYIGPKKPDMPVRAAYNGKMTEEHITSQEVSLARARNIDFQFLKDVLSKAGTPEYSYNTCICRETGMNPSPKSVFSYLPLLNMVAVLGGMHLLMDFVACIGTLTTDCGLKEVLSTTFGSVEKMLSGKKYPQNVRALRLLVEELLRPVLERETITSMEDLEKELEQRSSQSRTTKMWVDIVIRPVLIIMLYCRASHENDWLLHLKATEMMIPYMFAAHK